MEITELQQTVTAIQEKLLSMENECRQLQITLKNLIKSNEKYSSIGLFVDANEKINAAAVSLDYADSLLCADFDACQQIEREESAEEAALIRNLTGLAMNY